MGERKQKNKHQKLEELIQKENEKDKNTLASTADEPPARKVGRSESAPAETSERLKNARGA